MKHSKKRRSGGPSMTVMDWTKTKLVRSAYFKPDGDCQVVTFHPALLEAAPGQPPMGFRR